MSALAYHRMKGPGDFDAPAELELDDDAPEDCPVCCRTAHDDETPCSPTGRKVWSSTVYRGNTTRDPLVVLAEQRRRVADAFQRSVYESGRQRAMRPTIGQLRMVEAAIRCDVACREALSAWKRAA